MSPPSRLALTSCMRRSAGSTVAATLRPHASANFAAISKRPATRRCWWTAWLTSAGSSDWPGGTAPSTLGPKALSAALPSFVESDATSL